MIQEERLVQIKKMLKKEHQVSTQEIAKKFGVSFDTARRDVIHLATTGQAVRIHGGMMEISQNDVPDFLARNQVQSPVKLKMAKMATSILVNVILSVLLPRSSSFVPCLTGWISK